jgi:hypothetical protein
LALVLGLAPGAIAGPTNEAAVREDLDQAANAGSYHADGIPMPLVDSAVEGWFKYLGDGHFVMESGREFFWRDGRFVNADGSLMDLPASSKDHLKSIGIEHQPTAGGVDVLQAYAPDAGMRRLASWGGSYLHWGGLKGTTYNKTAVQADINIYDRSQGFAEYYMVGLYSPYPDTYVCLQLSDEEYTSTSWVPNVHYFFGGVGQDYVYTAYAFTAQGAVWKNLKLAVMGDGTMRAYLENTCIDWDAGTWIYSPAQTRALTQFEIGSDSNIDVPHNPANHHANIQTRSENYSTWSYQTTAVTKYSWLNGGTGLYNYWVPSNPSYDWMVYHY